jgi:hypothetical protein
MGESHAVVIKIGKDTFIGDAIGLVGKKKKEMVHNNFFDPPPLRLHFLAWASTPSAGFS